MPQRNPSFFNGPRPPYRPRPPFNALPPGWSSATAENGATYYYNANGGTQWQRPTLPAPQPPPPPPKEKTNQQKLQDIILSITQNATPRNETSASATPQPTEEPKKDKKERWRSLSEEKKMKLYENTVRKRRAICPPKVSNAYAAFPSCEIRNRSLPKETRERRSEEAG